MRRFLICLNEKKSTNHVVYLTKTIKIELNYPEEDNESE